MIKETTFRLFYRNATASYNSTKLDKISTTINKLTVIFNWSELLLIPTEVHTPIRRINCVRSVGFSRLHFFQIPLTKAWQLQQLLVYLANQKGSDVQNKMLWSLAHGTRVVKGLYLHGHNGICVITADLSMSLLLCICLIRQEVGRKWGWLSCIVSSSLPYPLLAEAMADADGSVVAVVLRNLSWWERLNQLRFTCFLVPAHYSLSIICERCWITFYQERAPIPNTFLPRHFHRAIHI